MPWQWGDCSISLIHAHEKQRADHSAVFTQRLLCDQEEDEMEEMFIMGPKGIEWGGPTRGGRHKEPTRYGDWERKGRCCDFN